MYRGKSESNDSVKTVDTVLRNILLEVVLASQIPGLGSVSSNLRLSDMTQTTCSSIADAHDQPSLLASVIHRLQLLK